MTQVSADLKVTNDRFDWIYSVEMNINNRIDTMSVLRVHAIKEHIIKSLREFHEEEDRVFRSTLPTIPGIYSYSFRRPSDGFLFESDSSSMEEVTDIMQAWRHVATVEWNLISEEGVQ